MNVKKITLNYDQHSWPLQIFLITKSWNMLSNEQYTIHEVRGL